MKIKNILMIVLILATPFILLTLQWSIEEYMKFLFNPPEQDEWIVGFISFMLSIGSIVGAVGWVYHTKGGN